MDVRFEFPLQWLPQQPRTRFPRRARFGDHSTYKAGNMLVDELSRLGAKNVVLSTNLEQRKRGGGFYANQRVDDPGVVAYFDLKGDAKAMACDQWDRPEHNLWALYLSVSAIRGLDRWGGSEFLDGLFTGFKALPAPGDVVQSAPQYFADVVDSDELRDRYRRLAKELHPDRGGSEAEFSEMMRQYTVAKKQQED